jgi:hypothetical protein
VAAQVLANEPALAAWPEGARAVLMAGAVHRVPMPDGSRSVDHEGVGMISAVWANRAAVAGDNTLGGYRLGQLTAGQQPVQQISVRAGDRLRVALAWNSNTSGSGNLNLSDQLLADLDLRVTDPTGHAVGSFTFDNAYEFVEVTMPASGVATLQVLQARFDGTSETYGLAWVKVRDTTRPTAGTRTPRGGEPWAVPTSIVRTTFSEPVSGVTASAFRLQRSSDGSWIQASVSYNAATRTATLVPSKPLKPGRYQAVLRDLIADGAGNALKRVTWTFTVRKPGAGLSTWFAKPRRIVFDPGKHIGYRFDADGEVTATKAVTLSRASGAHAARRATLQGVPGVWLRVTDGVWAGYWIRESPQAALKGRTGTINWSNPRHFIVRPGTHLGRKFDAAGKVTKSKSYKLSRTSGAQAGRRAIINGQRHLLVEDGIWAGYWLPESSVIYIPGMLDLQDLGDSRARMSAGTRTAYRYDRDGEQLGSRKLTLSSASGAPVRAWGVINGRPSLYVEGGGWAGYWLPETAGVSVP